MPPMYLEKENLRRRAITPSLILIIETQYTKATTLNNISNTSSLLK